MTNLIKRSLLLTACVALASTALAQRNLVLASPQNATAAAKPILFEVVSIRKYKEPISYGPGFTADGCQYRGISVLSLLLSIYGDDNRVPVEGLPSWGLQERYEIVAKVADADIPAWGKLDFKQRNLAMQALLQDRFKLTYHRETRQMPIYNLVVAKNGPKLKEVTPGDKYEKGAKYLNGEPMHGILMGMRTPGLFVGQDMTTNQLAASLRPFAARPVTDITGLTGHYDIALKLDPPQSPPPPSTGAGDSSDPTGASFFTVLQEQLGLKLEPAKGPVPVVVIDHVERPTEN